VLADLVDRGVYLSVATSKLKTFAGEIIDHFDLRRYFAAVHGSELDGSNAVKADLIAHILSTENIDASQAVMIGDRSHDVVGARANGVASIGVLWGYGDRQELLDAGANHIASSPSDLPRLITVAVGST
jgi:phosphoglycolate phosphatase